ncbi:MAG: sulfotransferase family 2 domain-containing protein [Xanthomonadales bacterium]|nr:sulfotransferase family 2 domain-containing protein [Xanthomonadales bacterium]
MLISDEKQFIFVHVRKAAGSSMRRVLRPYAVAKSSGRMNKLLSRAGLVRDYRRRWFRHHAALSDAQQSMPADRFRSYFKFAFVRNPWDRLVSEYEFLRGFPRHRRHQRAMQLSFPEFVRYQATRSDAYQFPMLCDRSGQVGMDFIGRFENLQADFDHVCHMLRLEPIELPHANRGETRDPAEYYDAETIEFVRETWRDAVELFGYTGPGK